MVDMVVMVTVQLVFQVVMDISILGDEFLVHHNALDYILWCRFSMPNGKLTIEILC